MGFLTIFGTGFGAYIMVMAALSPCPLLVHTTSGTFVIVRQLFLTGLHLECSKNLHVLHTAYISLKC